MSNKRRNRYTGLAVLLFLPFGVMAQAPSVQTIIDRNEILIGEPVKIRIKVTLPQKDFPLQWPALPDSVPHFELMGVDPPDTARQEPPFIVSQTITFTSFDSGRWHIPALPVGYTDAKGKKSNVYSDSMLVTVSFLPDSTNTIRDIKPIMEAGAGFSYFLYLIIAGVVLLLLIIGLLLYFFLRKKKPVLLKAGSRSAYEEAIHQLDALKNIYPDTPDLTRQYHTKLSDILRRYLTLSSNSGNVMNKTTGDLLVSLKGDTATEQIISQLSAALRCGDAVKFARYQPPVTESIASLEQVRKSIEHIAASYKTNPS